MTEPRGPLIASYGAGCLGWLWPVLMVLFGAMVIAGLLASSAGSGPETIPLGERIIPGLMGLALVVWGVHLLRSAARRSVLIFENGFVCRDWRDRERFVPWERLRAVELRPYLFARPGPGLVWSTVVLVTEREDGSLDELTMGEEGTGWLLSWKPSPMVAALAERAGLQRYPQGCLWGGETWHRPPR